MLKASKKSPVSIRSWLLIRRLYHQTKAEIYRNCYSLLGVSEESTQDEVREAYINLVKKVHPDSGHEEANAETFSKIDSAFRTLQAKYAKERRGIPDDPPAQTFDIKHTAPQHRQYLSYDGTGYGPPSQRQKQYQQIRASKAYEKVLEYRVEVATASEGTLVDKQTYYKNHAIKTKYGFDRVVEDLIQEAMSKGDFDNLSGSGKPLSSLQSQNPYVDFTQHKINKILLDNGFTPEWIMLQKEIREELDKLKESLTQSRLTVGPCPLNGNDEIKWKKIIVNQSCAAAQINKKIDKFNYLVPILTKQLIRIDLNRIGNNILINCACASVESDATTVHELNSKESTAKGLLASIWSFF